MIRSRLINTFGLCFTAVVLVIVLITKFLAGAWITILAMFVFFVIMKAIRRHYDNVTRELAADDEDKVLPTRVHAIVLVSKLHKPTLRALAFAKATRPNVLEAVYVGSDDKSTKALLREWDERNLGVPLKVLYSPYRELVRPIVDYATQIRKANPRGVVAVYIPEYVVGRWWEQLLHNQTALRLKGRLLFTPGVMVTSVPYQLRSSQIAREREEREWRGSGRRPASRAGPRRPRTTTARSHGDPHEPRPLAHVPTSAGAGGSRAPGSASGTRSRSDRSPTAATASPGSPPTSPDATASSSCGTRMPGERVVVEVTEGTDGDRFWRGDAVEVRDAVAGPGAGPVPVRRTGRLRRLRLPARRRCRAARAEGRRGPRAAAPAGRARPRR